MLSLAVNVGEGIRIGDEHDPTKGVAIRVDKKSGQAVRLTISTAMTPVKLLPFGLFPPRYTSGLTGEPRRILEPLAVQASA